MTASKTRSRRKNARPGKARASRPRNWESIIERLNHSRSGELTIRMGSPGSAQVTRVRLLAEWNNLEATTVGATLFLRLPSR